MNYFFTHPNKAKASDQIRLPRFAGSWYPAQADALNKMLSTRLQKASSILSELPKSSGKSVLAIIAPHAGYVYSGQTAAFAYSALSTVQHKRIFLLGPSHHAAFIGAVLPSQSFFETPMGNIEIDRATVDKLLTKPGFQQVDQVFDIEHSLELQLPWIRKTLGKVKIIPLVIGSVDSDSLREIAAALKKELQTGDVVIVSSDFTHYGSRFDYQPFAGYTGSELRKKITALDREAFDCFKKLDSTELLDFYEKTHDTICGIYPCAILLSLLPPDTEAKLLNYSTSADSEKEDQDNSVSYMAIAFSAPNWIVQNNNGTTDNLLSQSDGEILLRIAKQTLQDYLAGVLKKPSEYTNDLPPEQISRFAEERGVFVTLYKKPEQLPAKQDQHPHKQLRGCIGYIYPVKSLLTAVCENTINAASADPRFSPVTADELNKLELEINVLTKPKSIPSWTDIRLGKDGIVLKKGDRQAVFLPKVAPEFGWNLEETLAQLSVKAGLSPSAWRENTEFEVFQSQIFY